jgi:hypothetical protein
MLNIHFAAQFAAPSTLLAGAASPLAPHPTPTPTSQLCHWKHQNVPILLKTDEDELGQAYLRQC